MKKSILVVDDEKDIGFLMKRILQSEGHDVAHVRDLGGAKRALDDGKFDMVFLDLNLNGEWGLDLIAHIDVNKPVPEVAVITALKNAETQKQLERAGIRTVIQKPFSRADILNAIA